MDINSLKRSYNLFDLQNNQKNESEKIEEFDFQKVLNIAINKEESKNITIPEKWTDNPFGIGSIDCAISFLKNNCDVDTENRIPTYEIKDEQYGWLAKRHKLAEISEFNTHTSEEQNLLADLVYLNVISPDDAKSFNTVKAVELTDYLSE